MGYRPPRKVYTLQFDAHDGLEVRATSVSTASFLRIAELSDAAKVDITVMRSLFEAFATESLRSWNLEGENGEPLPATVDGLLTLEFDFAFEIISSWMDAVVGVSDDLKAPSSGGGPSLEASIPMETLSESRAS